jgi:hypothetical protein
MKIYSLRRPGSGTFVVITTDANELVVQIHNRMPLILTPSGYARWLSDEPDPRSAAVIPDRADADVADFDAGVNKPENDDPSILETMKLSAASAPPLPNAAHRDQSRSPVSCKYLHAKVSVRRGPGR